MEMFQIRIQEAAKVENPLFYEAGHAHVIYGSLNVIGILEAGTASGNASVAFLIKLPDGKYVIAETTAALMHIFDSALKGAEFNFAQKQK